MTLETLAGEDYADGTACQNGKSGFLAWRQRKVDADDPSYFDNYSTPAPNDKITQAEDYKKGRKSGKCYYEDLAKYYICGEKSVESPKLAAEIENHWKNNGNTNGNTNGNGNGGETGSNSNLSGSGKGKGKGKTPAGSSKSGAASVCRCQVPWNILKIIGSILLSLVPSINF